MIFILEGYMYDMATGEALITKKVIAYSFKHLMKNKEFHKISITEIMSHAGLRRQTFYDYFTDKYDLLTWIYNQEFTENVWDFLDYEHWTKVLPRILNYFKNNQLFYQKALFITEQNSFDQFFQEHTKAVLVQFLTANIAKTEKNITIEQYAYFYSLGTTGIIKGWILDDCQRPIEDIADFLITIIRAYFYQENSYL